MGNEKACEMIASVAITVNKILRSRDSLNVMSLVSTLFRVKRRISNRLISKKIWISQKSCLSRIKIYVIALIVNNRKISL